LRSPRLLKNMGYSYQKARFVSDHLADVAPEQQEWLEKTWPELRRQAQARNALVLFGDECSFAQWGSLSSTWSRRGHQPEVKTSGQRRAYKVFGIQDGARYHISQAMQAFFAAHTDRITVYQLLRYSPDFNPIEIGYTQCTSNQMA